MTSVYQMSSRNPPVAQSTFGFPDDPPHVLGRSGASPVLSGRARERSNNSQFQSPSPKVNIPSIRRSPSPMAIPFCRQVLDCGSPLPLFHTCQLQPSTQNLMPFLLRFLCGLRALVCSKNCVRLFPPQLRVSVCFVGDFLCCDSAPSQQIRKTALTKPPSLREFARFGTYFSEIFSPQKLLPPPQPRLHSTSANFPSKPRTDDPSLQNHTVVHTRTHSPFLPKIQPNCLSSKS